MPLHRVTWEIDIEADTARAAALRAQEIQRNPASSATVFKVHRESGGVATFDLVPPRPAALFRQRQGVARRHL
jgi:hypothetical protein